MNYLNENIIIKGMKTITKAEKIHQIYIMSDSDLHIEEKKMEKNINNYLIELINIDFVKEKKEYYYLCFT